MTRKKRLESIVETEQLMHWYSGGLRKLDDILFKSCLWKAQNTDERYINRKGKAIIKRVTDHMNTKWLSLYSENKALIRGHELIRKSE